MEFCENKIQHDINHDIPIIIIQKLIEKSFYKSYQHEIVTKDEKLKKILKKCVMNSTFSDYHCMITWSFFAWLKKNKLCGVDGLPDNKTQIGNDICRNIPKNNIIESIIVGKKDYININVSNNWLSHKISNIFQNKQVFPPEYPKKNVIIDYSSPNIAKTMHVGHLRSTIIGNSIYKLFKFLKCDITALNHFGDCGTQFGMLLEYINRNHPDFLENPLDIHGLEKIYKLSKKCFDADEDFKKNAKLKVVALQSGDEWATVIWKKLVEISKVNYQVIYDILGIENLIDRGESYYIKYLPPLVESLLETGLIEEEENGAKVIRVPKHKGVFMVQKGDGGYGYDSTDLAAIKQRLTEMNADQIVYVTDVGQQSHFYKLFDAARMFGWCDGKDVRLDHLGFGLILSKEGGKFRTRSGEVIHLIDLLTEAKRRSLQTLKERKEDGSCNLNDDELEDTAEKIGYGAVKYFDLRLNITKNYTFDYDQMLSLNGNTAVYIQYTYARIQSIFRQNDLKLEDITENLEITEDKERELLSILSRYQEYLLNTVDKLSTSTLCDYVYKVSCKFNEFYSSCKINGHENMNSRLQMCYVTSLVIEKFLYLLGISTVDKM